MIYINVDEVIEEPFESLLDIYRIGLEYQVILSLIVFIYCITNAIK